MKQNNFGFTFIELIIYVALVTIFISGAITFAWDAIYSQNKSTIQEEAVESARLALARIAFEVRNASAINSVSGSTLSLANADSTRNPTVFDLSGGRIRIGYGSTGNCPTSAPCFLTSNLITVSALSFTNLSLGNSKNINFSLTVSASGARNEWQISQTYSSSAELRTL
jgi:type II secretory pathway pseudopilin PulG